MYPPTAPALLTGLGIRIFLDKLSSLREPALPTDPRIGHTLLVGVWHGAAIYHAFIAHPSAAPAVCIAVAAKLSLDIALGADAITLVCTVMGIALGILGTDVLSQVLEDGLYTSQQPARQHMHGHGRVPRSKKTQRLVQFRRSVDGESRESKRRIPTTTGSTSTTTNFASSITSSDTIDPQGIMTPQEREIAALRMRASLADSERRRYKEEKKWAKAQGNPARAQQMGWQVKHYTTLMNSFHREADLRVIEASTRAQETGDPTWSRHRIVPQRLPDRITRTPVPSSSRYMGAAGSSPLNPRVSTSRIQ